VKRKEIIDGHVGGTRLCVGVTRRTRGQQ
jgi:hypothetical protein